VNRWSPGLASPVGQDGDPQPGTGGGPAFKGVDMLSERDQLAPGMVSFSVNKRFRTGSAMKRLGTHQPAEFNPDFGPYPIIGSGIYSDPNGNERMLVVTQEATYDFGGTIGVRAFVWSLQSGKDPERIPFAAGSNLVGATKVRFCQAFDKVLLFKEPIVNTNHTLIWDGRPAGPGPPVHTGAFEQVTNDPAAGGSLIPLHSAGETFQNRVLLYTPFAVSLPRRDQVVMTDPGDPTTYDNVFGDFRVNSGESDFMVRVFRYYKGAAVVFKHRSSHMIENFATADPTAASQRMLSGDIGLAGPDAVVRDGADVLFLSEPGGVYRLSEIIQEQIVTPAVPVSMNISPAIAAINWPAARFAVAASEDEYAFFAVPIKSSRNNTVLVYNRATRQWESGDVWGDPSFGIDAMLSANYDGKQTLCALDYRNKHIYTLYQSTVDTINGQPWHIHDIIETRGYSLGDVTRFKRFQRAAIAISTVDPTVYVTAISDGHNETKLLTRPPIVKNRLKFYPHGHADYDGTTNPDEPRREDYSVTDFDYAVETFEGLPVGTINQLPATGGYVDAPAQESLERIPIRTNGRWVSIRVENISGRCDLLAVAIEGIASNMETRTAA
jgi:hypothetical protein